MKLHHGPESLAEEFQRGRRFIATGDELVLTTFNDIIHYLLILVLCANISRVEHVFDFGQFNCAAGYVLLDPELVGGDVSGLSQTSAGCYGHAGRCVSEHPQFEVYPQILEQALESETIRRT